MRILLCLLAFTTAAQAQCPNCRQFSGSLPVLSGPILSAPFQTYTLPGVYSSPPVAFFNPTVPYFQAAAPAPLGISTIPYISPIPVIRVNP